ncbi:MAG: 4Fe-4S binding protein [Muribaculaceae bacterium]|nr:4Fe-4S binding protein [Muribaculaceae bacterium]
MDEGEIYHIQPEHCLHCGNCFEHCPVQAIERIG